MDYAVITILIIILWCLATRTRRMLQRLHPEEQKAPRELIVIRHSFSDKQPAAPEAAADPADAPLESSLAGPESAPELTPAN